MQHDTWVHEGIARIEADFRRSADTHLVPLPLPGFAAQGIDLYLKDESTHPTGSLKHRFARSLFLYALCNGWLREGMTVAAMRVVSKILGRKVGPSTGTNFVAMLAIAGEMRQRGEAGAVLSLLCDNGDRYLDTYHDASWADAEFGDCSAAERRFSSLI